MSDVDSNTINLKTTDILLTKEPGFIAFYQLPLNIHAFKTDGRASRINYEPLNVDHKFLIQMIKRKLQFSLS